jgi:hypothetical protein
MMISCLHKFAALLKEKSVNAKGKIKFGKNKH